MHDSLLTANGYKLRVAAADCQNNGYSWSRLAIYPETAGYLASLCSQLDWKPNTILTVEQNFYHKKFCLGDWPPEIDWLIKQTELAVRKVGISLNECSLESWEVNDVAIQRYDGPAIGIDWHRDFASDIGLISIFTVQGYAYLDIEKDSGDVERRLFGPGHVCMFVGPDPSSGTDRRLRHRVGPPLVRPEDGLMLPRISIALRMNAGLC